MQRIGLYSHKVKSYVPYIAPLFLADIDNRDAATARQRLLAVGDSVGVGPPQLREDGFISPGSVNASVVNLTTATLGIGTLAIPFAILNAGLVLFVVFLLAQAWLSAVSIREIVSALNTTELSSFEEISCVLFGRKLAVVVEICILLFCFGTAVSYHITIGDLGWAICRKFLNYDQLPWFFASVFSSRTGFLCTLSVVVLLPLCLFDKITELRFTCLIGLGCILATVGVVVYGLCMEGFSPEIVDHWDDFLLPRGFHQAMSALGVLTFAFCSQPNVPTIFYELGDRSIANMTSAVSRATGLCMCVYLVIGFAGVCRFATLTAPSIIQNLEPDFDNDNEAVVMAYGLLMFAVSMSFPLNVFPIKLTFEQLFIHAGISNVSGKSGMVAFLVVALSLVFAITIPNVTTIFDIIGATVGSFICFVLPPAIYLKILSLSGSLFCRRSGKAWVVLVTGSLLLVIGTLTTMA
jgi:amino acid permease